MFIVCYLFLSYCVIILLCVPFPFLYLYCIPSTGTAHHYCDHMDFLRRWRYICSCYMSWCLFLLFSLPLSSSFFPFTLRIPRLSFVIRNSVRQLDVLPCMETSDGQPSLQRRCIFLSLSLSFASLSTSFCSSPLCLPLSLFPYSLQCPQRRGCMCLQSPTR